MSFEYKNAIDARKNEEIQKITDSYEKIIKYCEKNEALKKFVYYYCIDKMDHNHPYYQHHRAVVTIMQSLYSIYENCNSLETLENFIGYYLHDDGYVKVWFDEEVGEILVDTNSDEGTQDINMYLKAIEEYANFWNQIAEEPIEDTMEKIVLLHRKQKELGLCNNKVKWSI